MSLTTSIHRDLLDATSRVALAAMLHDIGKFAERARIEIDSGRLDSHKTIYCPFRHKGGYHSHMHAAYSAVVIEDLAQDLPDLVGEICSRLVTTKVGRRRGSGGATQPTFRRHTPHGLQFPQVVDLALRMGSPLQFEAGQLAVRHHAARQRRAHIAPSTVLITCS